MAIYHLSVQVIGRSSGRSAVAAAAYRSAECITNEWDGVTHDYRKKNWVEFKEILLPENAPENFKDRAILWNSVEAAEKSKSAQLAREFEIALPKELSRGQQIEILETFARRELVHQGMCVDICMHNPPVTNDRHQPIDASGQITHDLSRMQFNNPHAHVLCTMRPIGPDGKWEPKSRAEYMCCRGQEERAMTADEYAVHKAEGWKKQYSYKSENNKKIWLTAEEGSKRGLKRLSKQPKTTPYGRKNPTVEYWNSEERILEWRKAWEEEVNERLQKIGSNERVDARSYKERQLDQLPTVHLGVSAVNMEKRAKREWNEGKPEQQLIRSDIGNVNRAIQSYNHMVLTVEKEIQELSQLAELVKQKICALFLSMKNGVKSTSIRLNLLEKQKRESDQELSGLKGRMEYYEGEAGRIQKKMNGVQQRSLQLKEQLKSFNHILHPKMASNLRKESEKAEKEQSDLEDYLIRVRENSGFQNDAEYHETENYVEDLNARLRSLSENMSTLKEEKKAMVAEYRKNYYMLPEELKQMVPVLENEERRKTENADEKRHRRRI